MLAAVFAATVAAGVAAFGLRWLDRLNSRRRRRRVQRTPLGGGKVKTIRGPSERARGKRDKFTRLHACAASPSLIKKMHLAELHITQQLMYVLSSPLLSPRDIAIFDSSAALSLSLSLLSLCRLRADTSTISEASEHQVSRNGRVQLTQLVRARARARSFSGGGGGGGGGGGDKGRHVRCYRALQYVSSFLLLMQSFPGTRWAHNLCRLAALTRGTNEA